MFEVDVDQGFAAAHALRNYKGRCENVHGHNWKVRVVIEGEKLDATGMLVDFLDVKSLMGEILDRIEEKLSGRWKSSPALYRAAARARRV